MQNNYEFIQKPLRQAVNKMMLNLMSLQQVEDHMRKVTEIQKYDRHEKKYLLDQKNQEVRDEDDYDSDSQVQQNYKNLDQKQLSYLIRKKLIYSGHCPESLQNVVLYDPDCRNAQESFPDSSTDINDAQIGQTLCEGEKKLIEVNQIFYDELINHKSLKALKFIIEELEKVDKY